MSAPSGTTRTPRTRRPSAATRAAEKNQPETNVVAISSGGRSATGGSAVPIRPAPASPPAATQSAAPKAPKVPDHLDPKALAQTLKTARTAVTVGQKRLAMVGEIRKLAETRKADAGWRYISERSDTEILTLCGSHVEQAAGGVKKLSQGGAKPDVRKA